MRHRCLINAVPILRNLALRLLESQAPRTNFSVEVILHFILGMRTPIGNGGIERFGPEILGISRIAAQFQWNEMVLLIIFQAGIGVAVFADLFDFQAMRVALFGTYGFRAPSRIANCFANIFLLMLPPMSGTSRGALPPSPST